MEYKLQQKFCDPECFLNGKKCDRKTGNYRAIQQHGGKYFCVNRETGEKLPGGEAVVFANIMDLPCYPESQYVPSTNPGGSSEYRRRNDALVLWF